MEIGKQFLAAYYYVMLCHVIAGAHNVVCAVYSLAVCHSAFNQITCCLVTLLFNLYWFKFKLKNTMTIQRCKDMEWCIGTPGVIRLTVNDFLKRLNTCWNINRFTHSWKPVDLLADIFPIEYFMLKKNHKFQTLLLRRTKKKN